MDDLAILDELNRNYIRSVQEADVGWFRDNLTSDFLNSNPDGTLVDRAAFLEQIARPVTISGLQAEDVRIRIFGDMALIHARTRYRKPDGQTGAGRYTDTWQRRGTRWLCVAAHVTRS
jgi:ketosteroid isomerase-like protein